MPNNNSASENAADSATLSKQLSNLSVGSVENKDANQGQKSAYVPPHLRNRPQTTGSSGGNNRGPSSSAGR